MFNTQTKKEVDEGRIKELQALRNKRIAQALFFFDLYSGLKEGADAIDQKIAKIKLEGDK